MPRRTLAWIVGICVALGAVAWFAPQTHARNEVIAACQAPLVEREQAMEAVKAQADASIANYNGSGSRPYLALPSRDADPLREKCDAVGVYIEPLYVLTRMPTDAETYEACLQAAADAGVSGESFGCIR